MFVWGGGGRSGGGAEARTGSVGGCEITLKMQRLQYCKHENKQNQFRTKKSVNRLRLASVFRLKPKLSDALGLGLPLVLDLKPKPKHGSMSQAKVY